SPIVSECRSSPFFFFSSRRRHTRFSRDWSSDVCSSDLAPAGVAHLRTAGRVLRRLEAEIGERIGAPGLTELHTGLSEFVRALHRSEERRVGKSVDLGGRRDITTKSRACVAKVREDAREH